MKISEAKELSSDIEETLNFFAMLQHQYKHVKKRIKNYKGQLQEALQGYKDTLRAIVVLKTVGEKTQREQLQFIEGLVSKALLDVFEEEAYAFKIIVTQTQKALQVDFVFVKDGEEYEPMECCEYGAVDVACFGLRVALFALLTPKKCGMRTIILDEPFKHLSEMYRERVGELVQKISEELKIQFIIVTHIKEMPRKGDNVIVATKESVRCEHAGK